MDIRVFQCAGEDDDGNNEDYNGCHDKEKVEEQKREGAKEERSGEKHECREKWQRLLVTLYQ